MVSLSLPFSLSLFLCICVCVCVCIHIYVRWANWNIGYVDGTQECVPVILSDQIELPFQNVIDYTQISIKWPATQIGPELLEYLESIPGLKCKPPFAIIFHLLYIS